MSFEISGKLIEKYPVMDISDKFRKRDFVISKTETSSGFEYTDYLKFQLVQEKCNLIEPFEIGDEIKVSFNLKGRKWEKEGTTTYFTNLEAWKVEEVRKNIEGQQQSVNYLNTNLPEKEETREESDFSDDMNDLPF